MQFKNINVVENHPLRDLTTFKIGGPARYFVRANSVEAVKEALEFAEAQKFNVFILGGGSNILVADRGFDGLVIAVDIKGMDIRGSEARLSAGEVWDDFVGACVVRGLAGIECLSGIPGKAGAAPVQNIGAYGQEVATTITEVEAIEIATKRTRVFGREECRFGYRSSIFNTTEKNKFIITHVNFRFTLHGAPSLRYANVKSYFQHQGISNPSLSQVRDAVIDIREKKGMVVLPGREHYYNAGSFFKSVVVSENKFSSIERIVLRDRSSYPGNCCPDPWYWRLSDDKVKISTACLVHCAGFPPGARYGRVGTSPRQTLAITNFDSATAAEVMEFVEKVRDAVQYKFGVLLEIEPELVGFS